MKKLKRHDKYLVIELEDIDKYLGAIHKAVLFTAIGLINIGRESDGKKPNNYIVVNKEQDK